MELHDANIAICGYVGSDFSNDLPAGGTYANESMMLPELFSCYGVSGVERVRA
jgi:hypothetical protein